MIDALKEYNIPGYLMRMISSYLKSRVLTYTTTDGIRRKRITAGAAQGSVIASRDREGAQMKLNQVMRRLSQWMADQLKSGSPNDRDCRPHNEENGQDSADTGGQ